MAAYSATEAQMSSITLTWKDDASAGAVPAHVHFSKDVHASQAHSIGRHLILSMSSHVDMPQRLCSMRAASSWVQRR